MGSKKQRSMALKAKAAGQSNNVRAANNNTGTATKRDEASASPFLRLPREVRDKICDELLIARRSPKDQEKYDQILAASGTPCGDFGRENALDFYEQDICLTPGGHRGGNRGYTFIRQAMGILLANKQIHQEANTALFSKNTFLILVEHERVYPFWRCERSDCHPPGSPCYFMFHLFKEIKHVYIIISNLCSMADPVFDADSARINRNLQTVARCFRQGGNKLKTLKFRYTSCFDGQIDAVRETLEGPIPKSMPERTAMLEDRYGQYYQGSHAEAASKLFYHHKILDPLRNLKGIAEYVHIRGDLPGPYMDELRAVLSVPETDLGAKAKKKRQEQDRGLGFHAFMKKMADNHKGAEDGQFYLDLLKVPTKSRAVMADLMKPPTQEELDRIGASQAAQALPMP